MTGDFEALGRRRPRGRHDRRRAARAAPGQPGRHGLRRRQARAAARRASSARGRSAWSGLRCSIAGVLGALAGLVPGGARHRRRDVTLPFGPYLAAGTVARPRLAGLTGDRRTPPARRGGRYHAQGAPLPDRRGIPRPGPGRDRRRSARRPADHGRGGPGRAGPPAPRLRPRAPDALRGRRVTLLGGIRHGRTLGSPVAIEIKNTEWFRSDRWHEEMSPAPGRTEHPLTQPRPGHADLAGMQKYGFRDARDVLERASARETAARVAAGCLAKAMLAPRSASGPEPRRADGPGPLEERHASRAGRPRGGRRLAGALLRRRRPGGHDRRDRGAPPRRATHSAAWSRCSPTASRRVSAAMSTGTASSTACSPRPS